MPTDAVRQAPLPPALPRLTQARTDLMREVQVQDEFGLRRSLRIPNERPLAVYVDRQELVTLMTLGAAPEWLVLGYLRNQRLIARAEEVESITVDWSVQAAAVRTRDGIAALQERTARRVVTTGCGQGTVFGEAWADCERLALPPPQAARISQSTLYAMLEAIRQQDSIHRQAGSVHGCALFRGRELLYFVEDVGRHNAVDTIAGWMAMHGVDGADKAFYSTGRLTSEMVMKAALMGVPIIVSRNGVTQMGHALAERMGMTLFGRATHRHFICYSGFERFDAEPQPERPAPRVVRG